jgi:hypothetical protein
MAIKSSHLLVLMSSLLLACGGFPKQMSEMDRMTEAQLRAEQKWVHSVGSQYLGGRWQADYSRNIRMRIVALHPEWRQEIRDAVIRGEVILGMTADQAIVALGPPDQINRTVHPRLVREQWVYDGGVYLYMENGILVSWQDRR